MALQMLQIFSSAGVCRSGHPKSSTWLGGAAKGHIHAGLCPLHSLQPANVHSPGHVPTGGNPAMPDAPLTASSPTLHPAAQTPASGALSPKSQSSSESLGSAAQGSPMVTRSCKEVSKSPPQTGAKMRPHKLTGKSQCFPSPVPPAEWDRKGGCSSQKQLAANPLLSTAVTHLGVKLADVISPLREVEKLQGRGKRE